MKKTICVILTAALSGVLLSPVFAEDDITAEGKWGSNVTWRIKNGTLTISGSGAMKNVNISGGSAGAEETEVSMLNSSETTPWQEYDFSRLVVEEGITAIGRKNFTRCTALETVILPSSLTGLGTFAFMGCTALETITLPAVENVRSYAFAGCTALTSAYIAEGTSEISGHAFDGCTALTDVNIPSTVSSIGVNAFKSCAALTEANIPEGVSRLGGGAFADCVSITSVHIPSTLDTLDMRTMLDIEHPFLGCTALEAIEAAEDSEEYVSVDGVLYDRHMSTLVLYPPAKGAAYTIPEGVRCIGEGAFMSSSVESVTLPETARTISEAAFADCAALSDIDISHVTYIGRQAFYCCFALDTALPAGISLISDWSFTGTGLRNAIIPEGVTSIGRLAFLSCNSLESITIPASIRKINPYAADNCGKLTDVYYKGTEEEWKQIVIDTQNDGGLLSAQLHFVPQSDTVIERGSGTVTLCGSLSLPPKAMLIRAEYDADGRMTDVSSQSVDKLNSAIPVEDGGKVMLWRSMTGIMPMAAAEE